MIELIYVALVAAGASHASVDPVEPVAHAAWLENFEELVDFAIPAGPEKADVLRRARARVENEAARTRMKAWFKALPEGKPWSPAERREFEGRVRALAEEIYAPLREVLLDPHLATPSGPSVAAMAKIFDVAARFAALMTVYPGNRGAQYLHGYSLLVWPAASAAMLASMFVAGYGIGIPTLVPWIMGGTAAGTAFGMHLFSRTPAGQRYIWDAVPYPGRAKDVEYLADLFLAILRRKVDLDHELLTGREDLGEVESEEEFRRVLPFERAAAAGCARWLAGDGEAGTSPGVTRDGPVAPIASLRD